MPFKNALYPGDFKEITIKWSKPIIREEFIEEGSIDDEYAQLYMIIGKFGKKSNLFYIGKTDGYVSDRLTQKDHLEKYKEWKKDHPRQKFHVSLGTMKISEGRITKNLINNIETLLIYSHYNDDFQYIKNVKNAYSYNITNVQYRIINEGSRKPLYEEIIFGIFYK